MLIVTRRRLQLIAAASVVIIAAGGLVIRNQLKVARGRVERNAAMQQRHPARAEPPAVVQQRQALFDLLRPVALSNCELERFGEANDGGYLMCANLLAGVAAGYSFGIGGYDGWGCQVASTLDLTVHQYDCFNTRQPACFRGKTVFQDSCVGGTSGTIEGRTFDTIANHVARTGSGTKRVVMKIDVEGAEWDSFLATPDDTLAQIDQLAVEFHWEEGADGRWVQDERHLRVVERLKRFFEVVHVHFNNAACIPDLAPFPSFAYEVLFVSKRLAAVAPGPAAAGPHQLDARNNPSLPDCQAL